MSISDGEFFELFKRMLQKKYVDPSGMPGLQSKDLIRPFKRSIITSAGAKWDRIFINRAVYIWTPDRRQINFVSGYDPGDLSADTAKPYNSSVSGFAKLYAPGEWWINTPLLTGDTEGRTTTLVVSDAALGIENNNMAAADLIGQVVADPEKPIKFTSFAPITVNAADTAVLSANGLRRGLTLCNASAAGQVIAVTDEAAATAANRGIWIIAAGQMVYIDTKCPTQALRAWASAAGGVLSGSEGV